LFLVLIGTFDQKSY